jgi:hypothetical protein
MSQTELEARGADTTNDRVRRRLALYIPGVDPRGPAIYHRMFVEESALQSRVSGARIEVGRRRKDGPHAAAWTIEADFGDGTTTTDYRFLRWDEEVRALWTRSGPAVLAEMWGVMTAGLGSGFLARNLRRSWPVCAAIVGPTLTVSLLQLAAAGTAVLSGGLVFLLCRALHAGGIVAWAAGLAAAALPIAAAFPLWRRIDETYRVAWLSRATAIPIKIARGRLPLVEAAADRLAGQIIEAAAGEVDELLIVGHSAGAGVSIMALARALRREPELARSGVGLLTVGGAIAAYDYFSKGGRYHDDLSEVAASRGMTWLDVGAPPDMAATARLDPLELVPNPATRPIRRWPMFHALLPASRYRRMRTAPFDMHFQYLKASGTAGGYDFFRLVCGPDHLADFQRGWTRFEGIPE